MKAFNELNQDFIITGNTIVPLVARNGNGRLLHHCFDNLPLIFVVFILVSKHLKTAGNLDGELHSHLLVLELLNYLNYCHNDVAMPLGFNLTYPSQSRVRASQLVLTYILECQPKNLWKEIHYLKILAIIQQLMNNRS